MNKNIDVPGEKDISFILDEIKLRRLLLWIRDAALDGRSHEIMYTVPLGENIFHIFYFQVPDKYRIVEMERERPSFFSSNLLQKTRDIEAGQTVKPSSLV